MKKLFTTFKTLLLGGLLFSSTLVEAQTIAGATGSYPLNTDRTYANGIAPTAADKYKNAISSYNSWKQTYTATDCNGTARVIFDFYPGGLGATDRSETVSEGIAYGMLLSAYAGDRSLFDGLWSFYKNHRNENGVMNWKIRFCNQVTGANGASDAELDAAMALVVASYQWQSDGYLNDAKTMMRIIREKEFEGSILKPGDKFGGSNLTNPSYFSPAYYEVFKQYDGNSSFWNAAIAKGYEIIDKADKNDLGLVPDWTDGNGNTTSAASQYKDGGQHFFFDAVRTPFRSAVDYLWHGRAEGKAYCEKLINWSNSAHGGGTEQLQSNYRINGNSLGGGHSNTFVACFGVAAMATSNQSYLNRAYADNQSTNPTTGQYFNATFKAIGNFVMSGNFYLPPLGNCAGPDLGADRSLCSGSSIQLNAGVTGATYEWRKDGSKINGATSQTYSVTSAGDYEVVTNQAGCVRRDKVNVGGATVTANFLAQSSAGGVTIQNTSTGGISDYAWSVDQGTTNVTTSTDKTPSFTGLTAGVYDITLTVSNTGFSGCTGTSAVTKKVSVGNGVGIAMDDFNDAYNQGVNAYTYPEGRFEAFPVTYCSRQAELDGDEPVCQDHRCSYIDLVCLGATAATNWASLEFEFLPAAGAPFDLSDGAFVAIKMSATEPVTVDVRLGQGDFSASPRKAAVTTTETVFTFDFTEVLLGQDGAGDPASIDVWDAVSKLTLRPYASKVAYTGTISVDYIIVGAKALSPPQFDIRKDEFGYVDYSNYLPKYYPNDPQYADCTPATEGPACYGTVPDWEREIVACGNTTVVKANACTASEIRWYKGTTLVATGDEAELEPGDYSIELIGAGGITKDVVKVIGSAPTAAFSVDRTNYDATFINQSTGFNTKVWSYGDPANDIDESTTWDIGYHSYLNAGDGTYEVSLTVTDTICGVSDTETKQLVVACDQLTGEITVTESTLEGCEGDVVEFAIEPVENANSYGWFGPQGTTLELAEDSLSAMVTFGSIDGPLSIQAYNVCGQSEKSMDLDLAGTPVGTFTLDPNTNGGFVMMAAADAIENDGETYAWTFGDGNSSTEASVEHTYEASLKNIAQTVCLTVTNRCGVSDEECDEFTPTDPVGFFTLNEQNVSMFPTATTNLLTVELTGKANVTISDVLGNTVAQSVVTDKGTINVADLSAGMYILSIKQGSEVVNKRFIKE